MSVALDLNVSVAAPDYAGLVDLVAAYLDRTDLIPRIPTFVELATRRFNRTLWVPERQVSVEAAVTGAYRLPDGFYQIRAIFVASDGNPPLEQCTVDTLRRATGGIGRPARYAMMGDTVIFDPPADRPVIVTIDYYEAIPGLGTASTSNWLLDKHPDAYLYGALVQAEAFLADDERVGVWKSALDEVLAEISQVGIRRLHGGGPLIMRPAATP